MCFAVQLSMCSLLLLFATALIEYQLVPDMSSTFFIFFEMFFYFSGCRFHPLKLVSLCPSRTLYLVSDRNLYKDPVIRNNRIQDQR